MHRMDTQRDSLVATDDINGGISKKGGGSCFGLRAIDIRRFSLCWGAVVGEQVQVNRKALFVLTNLGWNATLKCPVEDTCLGVILPP